jgi:YebC/PmpR family DNA-binding regulatory protein
MGRIFETRKATIFARNARVAKAFARCAREIAIAVKAGGPSAESNPALRRALQNARSANMPKDKVEAAIKRAAGEGANDFEEIVYEGYAPHGVAMMIVAATDNPTRTVANIRAFMNKFGGNLGASGSVAFSFTKMGVFRLNPEGLSADDLELELIDHGLQEMGESTGEDDQPILVVRCNLQDFGTMQAAIEAKGITPVSTAVEYIPQTWVEGLSDEQAAESLALVEKLEADDDIQHVFHNLA